MLPESLEEVHAAEDLGGSEREFDLWTVGMEGGEPEQVTFTAEAGKSYYFIVDGWQSGDSGPFDISVTCQ